MHARMLLPALFGLLLPVLVWAPSAAAGLARRSVLLIGGLLGGWALLAAIGLRVPYAGGRDTATGIADERGTYVAASGQEHPITADDYSDSPFARRGATWAARADAGEDVLILQDGTEYVLPDGSGVVAVTGNIGIAGVVAGEAVHIVDPLGLADPVAARMRLTERGRAGHEKRLPNGWIRAAYGVAVAGSSDQDASQALGCGDLRRLRSATTGPLSVTRLVENVGDAFALTTFRVDPEPARARAEQCG